MFKIYDGREHFYQWDLDRKLIVGDRTIQAVHFCNRTGACAITRDCYDVNGMWLVDVPNLCLQESYRLKVYGFSAAKYTTVSAQFDVKSRTKPDGYVYTDDEVNCWQALDQRVAALEDNPVSDEALDQAIEGYFAENPIEKGATDAEKEQIARNTEDIAALKSLSSTYATEEYVDAAIANIEVGGGDVDLTGYATEKWVEDKGYLTQHQDLTGYAKTEDIPSLNGYATEEYVDNAVANVGGECVVEVVNGYGDDPVVLDKTYEEIQAMVDEGKVVVINHDGLVYYHNMGLAFRYVGSAETRRIVVREDEILYKETLLTTAEDVEDIVNAAVADFQTAEQVNAAIEAYVGVIENGTY